MNKEEFEIEEVDTRLIKTKNPFKKQEGLERDEDFIATRKRWKKATQQVIEKQRSWKLIDGSIDEIRWSSTDDCWKWIKRFLTIGNIGVSTVCFCLLMGSIFVCFGR